MPFNYFKKELEQVFRHLEKKLVYVKNTLY